MSLAEESRFTKLKISGRLPTPKGVALEIINLTQKDDVSNHEVIRLISTDAALSLRVIKAANVLLGRVSRPVSTISDAVTVLGARALRQLVLGIALMLDYRHGPCKQFDYGRFWVHSLLTGITARQLAYQARMAAPDEIFMVGLLSKVGRLAFATVYPEDFGELIEQSKNKSFTGSKKMQAEKFGFDEAELSEAIFSDIRFPKIFQTMVREYMQPETSSATEGSREWQLLHLLHVASLMADACLAQPAERCKLVAKLRLQAVQMAIETDKLIEIGNACELDWVSWSSLLGMGKVELPVFAEMLRQADHCEADNELVASTSTMPNTYLLRVLLVEDDRVMMALLEAKLQAFGHTVATACNGVEAMEMIERFKPQLIIADWLMPKMDGITFCRKLREHTEFCNVYFIVMTAQEDAAKLVEAFEAGADDYLMKPINTKIFFARLRAGMRVVKLQEELAFEREQLMRLSSSLTIANDRLQLLALTDALTALPNRRAAMERLEQEWALSARGERDLACLMVDVDHFKSINDKYGHPVGDIALKHVAQTLRNSARTEDIVCRFGGEEFLVICPAANMESAVQCAERLRLNVANAAVDGTNPTIQVTVSIGVAVNSKACKSLDDLLTHADQNLYAAKQAGRNRTVA
ncbi:MAG: diguanylate cyclase [Gallionella sp.]